MAEMIERSDAHAVSSAAGETRPAARSCAIAVVLPVAVPPRIAPSRHRPGKRLIHSDEGSDDDEEEEEEVVVVAAAAVVVVVVVVVEEEEEEAAEG